MAGEEVLSVKVQEMVKAFEAWAEEIGAHFCATCKRAGSGKCPIERDYALPKDGFCHLWEERKNGDQKERPH